MQGGLRQIEWEMYKANRSPMFDPISTITKWVTYRIANFSDSISNPIIQSSKLHVSVDQTKSSWAMVRHARKHVCGTMFPVIESKHLFQWRDATVNRVTFVFTKVLTVNRLKLKIVNVGYHPKVCTRDIHSYIQVKKKKFSTESCKIRNEVYIEGGSPCQTNCATYGLKCLVTASKKVNACYCPDGYARISERGECVPVDSRECIDQMPVRRMNWVVKRLSEKRFSFTTQKFL